MDSVRHFASAKPYSEFAGKYRKAGWLNPIPLPPKEKGPPPDNFTGHRALDVDREVYEGWINSKPANSNIGIRLHRVKFNEWAPELLRDQTFEIVGIDIDDHQDEDKFGWSQYLRLAKTLGELPMTWTSSARTDGRSGIRLYLAPANLAWRGDCGKKGPDIDIICRTYRFAVVFPSFHPKGGQYYWYGPGFDPDGQNFSSEIPRPEDLSILPQKWVKFLTQDFTKYVRGPMDMDSDPEELKVWATKYFAYHKKMCPHMDKILTKRLIELEESQTSHPMLTKVHFELYCLGSRDGHTGWGTAVKEFERRWRDDVLARGKRSPTQADSEVERSRVGALRKIKGKSDEEATQGRVFIKQYDPCERTVKITTQFPQMPTKNVGEYRLNDDGNAEHFLDMHEGYIHYVPNVLGKWLLWDDRWQVDKNDFVMTLYRRVRDAQEAFAQYLWAEYEKVKGQNGAGDKKALAITWGTQARNSGMTFGISRALMAAKSVKQGVSIPFEEWDKDRRALGGDKKIIRFGTRGKGKEWRDVIETVENARELLITKHSGFDYVPLETLSGTYGFELVMDFFRRFRPMDDMEYFQKLCGSVLLGDVSNKFAIFFYGPKNAGKSTMLDLLVRTLADYAVTRNSDIFKSVHLNPALANALPARLMAIHEMGEAEINADLFKSITGGDKIVAELKGKNDLVEDYAQFTVIVDTNSVPNVPREDTAFRSRLRVIAFKHQADSAELSILGKERQRDLLEHGKQVCFSWLVEGAAKAIVEGLDPVPREISMATEEFITQLSDLGVFAKECIAYKQGAFVANADMKTCFETWAFANNFSIHGWTQTRLTQRLKDIGYKTSTQWVRTEDETKGHTERGFADIVLVKEKGVDS